MKLKAVFPLLTMIALGIASSLPKDALAAGNFPFGQNHTYNYGIKPTNFVAADNTTLQNLYNSWKSSHVVNGGCTNCLRVQRETNSNDTVSEGIGYGMFIAVYMDDQTTFNGLWTYKTNHNDGNGLMNWQINSGGGTIGANSATDADQDIAFSLYLADAQWGSGGTLNYLSLANQEVAKIKQYDMDPNHVKPGDSFNSCRYPSYFFFTDYTVYGKKTNDTSTWNSIEANCWSAIAAARNGSNGLVAEECTDSGPGGGCSGASSTQYQYNSCRVPFYVATDYVYYGDSNASSELGLLSGFFAGITPGNMGDCYNISGGTTCSTNNNDAFVGPAACAFMGASANQTNLNNWYNFLRTSNNSSAYYAGALQIMSLLLLTGNMPNIADPANIFTPTRTPTITPYAGSPTQTPTVTPAPSGVLFEDFETGGTYAPYGYASAAPNPVSSLTFNTVSTAPNTGLFCQALTVNVPTGGFAGWGCSSSYRNTNQVIDATGATSLRFFIKYNGAANINFTAAWHEGCTCSAGGGGSVLPADNESWVSPAQALAPSPNWQMVQIPLSTFVRDAYSGNQAGNKVQDLNAVFQFQIAFNPTVAANSQIYIDDIGFVLSVAHTPTPTSTPFVNPYNQIFDDFESPLSLSTTANPKRADVAADTTNGASAAWSINTSNIVGGTHSGLLTYNTGTGNSFGAGGWLISPYSTPGLYVDATGAVYLGMWLDNVGGPSYLRYQVEIQEASNTVVGGADGEAWLSSMQILNGTGWQWVQVPVHTFQIDPYTGKQNGNKIMDLQAISTVSIKLAGAQGSGSLYIDNVTFITSDKTSTPTVTPTFSITPTITYTVPAGTPTPTASPTPLPYTFTATPSATVPNSPTPSNTPSSSPTPPNTMTASPTLSPTLTMSPVNTATSTRTPSNSPTVSSTASNSPTISPTFTFNPNTPTISPTFSLTYTSSRTPTDSPTDSPTPTNSSTPTPSKTLTISPTFTNNPNTATPTYTITLSYTPLNTSTHTPVNTPTSTPTLANSPVNTATFTAGSTLTSTPPSTATNTAVSTKTSTPPNTPTNTAVNTRTFTPPNTATFTPTLTNTPLPAATYTPGPSPVATNVVPANGASYPANLSSLSVQVDALAQAPAETIASVVVNFIASPAGAGTATATWVSGNTWSTASVPNPQAGSYTYTVTVTDSRGFATTTAPASFTIGNPPTVSTPVASLPAGGGVDISLTTTANGGSTIQSVVILDSSNNVVGTATSQGNGVYTLHLATTPAGGMTLHAQVSDSAGLVTNSSSVQVNAPGGGNQPIKIVSQPLPYPNPVLGGSSATLYVKLNQVPDQLDLRLYSAGYRLVKTSLKLTNLLYAMTNDGQVSTSVPVFLTDDDGSDLRNGHYYFVVSAQGKNGSAKAFGTLVVIR